jgi:hypothetical protein
MSLGTGCISIAAPSKSGMQVDRVVEYFDPEEATRKIWVDVFLNNPAREQQPILILHRGNLSATNVTGTSWTPEDSSRSYPCSLTRRLLALHEPRFIRRFRQEPEGLSLVAMLQPEGVERIQIREGGSVAVGGFEYGLWNGPRDILPLLDGEGETDAPYTIWKLAGFAEPPRQVLRLELQLRLPSYWNQVGRTRSFRAYGEAMLLHKIGHEDLPRYRGSRAQDYVKVFGDFLSGTHLIPKIFEYLVVAPEGEELAWEATPLSDVHEPFIQDPAIRRNTRWFLADISRTASFSIAGEPYNSLALRLTARDREQDAVLLAQ